MSLLPSLVLWCRGLEKAVLGALWGGTLPWVVSYFNTG